MSIPRNVAFIGLGMMGKPMATLLVKAGHRVFASDADKENQSQFCQITGASPLPEGDAIIDVDIVITMLPRSDIVEAVVLGENHQGLVSRVGTHTCFIDMSSSEPLRSRRLAQTLADLGMTWLDAPVSGGVKRAINGTLSIIVGGQLATLEAWREVLELMGKCQYVGPAGAGHAMKALNNYVSAAGLLAAVEALHVGEKFGLDPAVMTDVLNTATGKNNATENKVKQFMLSGSYASGFALKLMVKDLGIAMGLGEQMDTPMRLGHQCLDVWQAAAQEADAHTDHTEMYRIVGHHG